MGGTGPPSQKTMVDATTNIEKKRYAQAAAQTQVELKKENRKEKEKEKGAKIPAVTSEGLKGSEVSVGLPHRFPYVEDLNYYKEKEAGVMAKAVVVHGVPTYWRINGVANCIGRIMGKVIGVRWLVGEKRREGKAASSVVVYLQNEVFLRPEAWVKMSGKRHSVVAFRWRA